MHAAILGTAHEALARARQLVGSDRTSDARNLAVVAGVLIDKARTLEAERDASAQAEIEAELARRHGR